MKMIRPIWQLVLLLVLLFLMSGFGHGRSFGQHRATPITLVPPNAVAVARVNWRVARQDTYFRAMLNTADMERALARLKVNGSEVSESVIFSGINSSRSGVLAAIFRGSYSLTEVNTQLKSQNFNQHIHKGRAVYLDPKDGTAAAMLRSGMLVVGSRKGVEGVIDVEINPQLGLSRKAPFKGTLARFLVSSRPISFVMALPLEYQTVADVGVKVVSSLFSISGLGPLGFVIDKIGFPHALAFSIEHKGTTFPTELLAHMKDATSAALISGTLNLAQSINLNMLSNRTPQADREMLQNLTVMRSGSRLSITMILREQDLMPRR